MSANLLEGTPVASAILAESAERARTFEEAAGRKACLATVLVGDDPASATYVRMKVNRCKAIGMDSRRIDLPASSSTDEVVEVVRSLSLDPMVDGILVQHPMGSHVDESRVFEAIDVAKDVDGVTAGSFASAAFGTPGFHSCTPEGIMRLLAAYDLPVAGKRAVVVGRSAILGKPVGMLLLGADATVTFCHSKTDALPEVVGEADIVVAAVGKPALVRGAWIRPGAVVVNAGYNPGNVGDVEYEAAAARAGWITPVPGGVGPMTIAVLLSQTLDAAGALAAQRERQL